MVEKVEKHERLQDLAEIGRAQPSILEALSFGAWRKADAGPRVIRGINAQHQPRPDFRNSGQESQ
jgi:hypothetical protein